MDKVYETSLLLDFYGHLLTDRQYEILDLHYNNDYTLTEIAEQLNISRQGVYDNEKRSRAILNEYEEKLGLLNKFTVQKYKAREILQKLQHLNPEEMSRSNSEIIDSVVKEISELISSM